MKMIQKTTMPERLNHWVLAASFFVLAVTGLGFEYRSLGWLSTVFGGKASSSDIHKWSGMVFGLSILASVFSYLKEALSFGPEDRDWLRLRGGYLGGHEEVPPQGKINTGQKLYYLTVLVFGLLLLASGLVIWLAGGSRGWMQIGHLIHNLSFVVLVTAVPLHIYLATAANPGTFRIMTRGSVPVAWAKRHYGKWVKQMGC
jgi:formate dehydrogenase subunit gamma